MTKKSLLALLALPAFCLASCGGAEFNMYNQNIRYDSPTKTWDDVDKNTGKTVKTLFTENFSQIDWETSSPVEKHSSAAEAIACMDETVAKNFKAAYSGISIKTDGKGSDPARGTGKVISGTKEYAVHFAIQQGEETNQNEFVFKDDKEEHLATIKIFKSYNTSIQVSQLTLNSGICGVGYKFYFKTPVTEQKYEALPVVYYANFIS